MSEINQPTPRDVTRYSKFEWGLLISLLMGLAYLAVYHYQVGVLKFYCLPADFVDINVTDITLLAANFGWLIYFIPLLYITMQPTWQKNALMRHLIVYCVIGMVLAISGLLLRWGSSSWTGYGIAMLLYAAYDFLWPPIFACYKGTYRERFEESMKTEGQTYDFSNCTLGTKVFVLVFISAFLLFSTILPRIQDFGFLEASVREDFLVYADSPCVVVRRYQGNLLCVDFDPVSKSLFNKFSMIPPSASIKIERKHIGKLTSCNTSVHNEPLAIKNTLKDKAVPAKREKKQAQFKANTSKQ